MWLREEEQYLPGTVSSCSGGVVVFATDYGQVRTAALCRRPRASRALTSERSKPRFPVLQGEVYLNPRADPGTPLQFPLRFL